MQTIHVKFDLYQTVYPKGASITNEEFLQNVKQIANHVIQLMPGGFVVYVDGNAWNIDGVEYLHGACGFMIKVADSLLNKRKNVAIQLSFEEIEIKYVTQNLLELKEKHNYYEKILVDGKQLLTQMVEQSEQVYIPFCNRLIEQINTINFKELPQELKQPLSSLRRYLKGELEVWCQAVQRCHDVLSKV